MEKEKFDYEAFKEKARKHILEGGSLLGKDGAFTPLLKEFLEETLEGELEGHLDSDGQNRKNGKGRKKVRTTQGEVEIRTPRDRKSTFQPKIVAKREKHITTDLERQIILLYARGSSYGDIRDFFEDMYGLELSTATISRITDKVLPLLQEWRSRPLESVYPFVFMDAIHFKVREEGKVVNKAVYCVIGVNQEGYKDLLGMYIGQRESAKFWMQVLSDLQARGVEDILIACIDNLSGFTEAIQSIFPKTEVQLCVVHQIRNSKKYLAWKDVKSFMADLKLVYQATTKEKAEYELNKLEQKWGAKYPVVLKSWRKNWDQLSTYFNFDKRIRKVIYTTNIIEGFHRQLRKVTKTKGAFTSDDALMKLLFLVQQDITKKWQRPLHNWNQTLSQLSIIYEDRLKLDV